jgi:transcriptional regulator
MANMFIPKAFEINDENLIHQWIDQYSFATLVSKNEKQLEATHLPLLLSENKKHLLGHMARGNSQWMNLSDHQVLVIFQGPHHYISPSWYETKDAVPTWNYISVHISGTLSLIESEGILIDSLETLTRKYESIDSKYKLSLADPHYLESLRKGIVGFQIEINKIEAKAKLSQNHPKTRQGLVIEELKKLQSENSKAIAYWMETIF